MSEIEDQQSQGGAYGEQQAELSDAGSAAEQATPSGADEAYGEEETRADAGGEQSAQETVEQIQGGFYRDEDVEDEADGQL